MILTVNINNTNILFSALDEGSPKFIIRLSTDKARTFEEYSVLMDWTAQEYNFDLKSVEGAIISSVVPPLTAVLAKAVKIVTGHKPIIVGPGVKTGLNIRLDDPAELGGDFVAAAVASIAKYPHPCIIIEMGTATAMGIIDKNANYIGGVICPGIMVSQEALVRCTAHLSNVSITSPPTVISKNTDGAMRSGLIYGSAATIDGIIERIERELGEKATIVTTGDWAETIVPLCNRDDMIIDNELIMRGLWLIYQKNKRR